MSVSVLSLLILFLGTHSVLSTEVEQCPNIPTPLVEIPGCTTPPCDLVKGTTAVLIVNFNSTEYVRELKMKVSAKVGVISVPYPLDPTLANVCGNLLNTRCPLDVNENGVYKLVMPISSIYPEISLKLSFTIESEQKNKIACFMVQCTVVPAAKINKDIQN